MMMANTDDVITPAESSRKVRKVLRAAFPKTTMSVKSRSSDIQIEWDDSITDVDGLTAALLNSGVAQLDEPHWNGSQRVTVDGHHLSLWSFNRAAQLEHDQRRQKQAARHAAEREALDAARRAKRSSRPGPTFERPVPPDPSAYEAFDLLRAKAEAQTAEHKGDRRPSWAPPLILGDELAGLCRDLGYLAADEKPIGRLWAHFASPKHSGRVLREQISTLPLADIICRGFQMFAGGERQSPGRMLFEAQRTTDGSWRFGPYWFPHEFSSSRTQKWESLIRERIQLEHGDTCVSERQSSERLAAVVAEIHAIDSQDAADSKKYYERQQRKHQALRLARSRVLDFVGAPDAQMQIAARLWGHCCRCGAELTDPTSLERGIGPECCDKILRGIRAMASDGRSHRIIAGLIGMPIQFVEAVLGEHVSTAAKPHARSTSIPDLFKTPKGPAINDAEDDWMLPGA